MYVYATETPRRLTTMNNDEVIEFKLLFTILD